MYGEGENAGDLAKLFLLVTIIESFQKQEFELLSDRVKFTEEEMSETAFLTELEEVRQNAFTEFVNLAKKNIGKCFELVQRLKDIEDYDKRVLDFFGELILRHVKSVIFDSKTLELEFTEVKSLLFPLIGFH